MPALCSPEEGAPVSKPGSADSAPRLLREPLLRGGGPARKEEEGKWQEEVRNQGHSSADNTSPLAPTALLAAVTPWKGTGWGFPHPFFFRGGDRRFQRTLLLPSLMPSVKKARVGTRIKELTGQTGSPGLRGLFSQRAGRAQWPPQAWPPGPQASRTGLSTSLSPGMEVPHAALEGPPLSPLGLDCSLSGTLASPSAG